MMNTNETTNDRIVPVGGDFSKVFDHKDYLAMVNTTDQAACILRAHLILEEALNLWANKVTNCTDLFGGSFVPFKTKLTIAKNLGFDSDLTKILDRINEIRNRFSHRRGYEMDTQSIESIKDKVNAITEPKSLLRCEEFSAFISGRDSDGQVKEIAYTYKEGDNRVKFLITFVMLMLKLSWWMQKDFQRRGIRFIIISGIDS